MKASYVKFTVLAYAISWAIWLPFVLASRGLIDLPAEFLGLLGPIGTFGPVLAASILTYRAGQLGPFFQRALSFKFPWYYWLIALLIWPAVQGLGLISAAWFGDFSIEPNMYLSLSLLIPLFMQTLVIGGPLGEEFGWRGYALPALLDRHGPITSSLILGFIHAFWHLPIWFVIGEGSRDMPFWLFTINVVSQTPIYTWLYLSGKRSVWPVIIFHTTQNIVFFQVFSVPNGMPAFAIFFYIAVLACVLGLVGKTYNKGSSALPRGSIEDAR